MLFPPVVLCSKHNCCFLLYTQYLPFVSYSLATIWSTLSDCLLYTQCLSFALYSVPVFCSILNAWLFLLYQPLALHSKLNCCLLLYTHWSSFAICSVGAIWSIFSACLLLYTRSVTFVEAPEWCLALTPFVLHCLSSDLQLSGWLLWYTQWLIWSILRGWSVSNAHINSW